MAKRQRIDNQLQDTVATIRNLLAVRNILVSLDYCDSDCEGQPTFVSAEDCVSQVAAHVGPAKAGVVDLLKAQLPSIPWHRWPQLCEDVWYDFQSQAWLLLVELDLKQLDPADQATRRRLIALFCELCEEQDDFSFSVRTRYWLSSAAERRTLFRCQLDVADLHRTFTLSDADGDHCADFLTPDDNMAFLYWDLYNFWYDAEPALLRVYWRLVMQRSDAFDARMARAHLFGDDGHAREEEAAQPWLLRRLLEANASFRSESLRVFAPSYRAIGKTERHAWLMCYVMVALDCAAPVAVALWYHFPDAYMGPRQRHLFETRHWREASQYKAANMAWTDACFEVGNIKE